MDKKNNGKKLLAIGEALIDFIPQQVDVGIANVESFMPAVGGAPANVCGAFSKLGGNSQMITKLGMDPFGDKILAELERHGIDCSLIKQTKEANTSLAFVALKEDGNREFSFYRKPGADMLFSKEEVDVSWFVDGYALHFCSVSLGDFPMKEAHRKAIQYAHENGLIVSFDPNLRPPLWERREDMIEAVREFLPLADIVKVSDEELGEITGKSTIREGIEWLFTGNVKMVLYTKGAEGAIAYTKTFTAAVSGKHVKAVDTTGAGDGFIGAFLYKLCESGVTREMLEDLNDDIILTCIKYANDFSAESVKKRGAIDSYPTCVQE